MSSRRAGLPSSASRSALGSACGNDGVRRRCGPGMPGIGGSPTVVTRSRSGWRGRRRSPCAGQVAGVVDLPALAHCHESERQSRPDRAHARAHMHARDGDRPHACSIVRAAAVAVHALAVEAAACGQRQPWERQRPCSPRGHSRSVRHGARRTGSARSPRRRSSPPRSMSREDESDCPELQVRPAGSASSRASSGRASTSLCGLTVHSGARCRASRDLRLDTGRHRRVGNRSHGRAQHDGAGGRHLSSRTVSAARAPGLRRAVRSAADLGRHR